VSVQHNQIISFRSPGGADIVPLGDVPPQVKVLNDLLADPIVADWLKKQFSASSSPPETKLPESEMTMISSFMDTRVLSARIRLRTVIAGAPNLSNELFRIFQRVREEASAHHRDESSKEVTPKCYKRNIHDDATLPAIAAYKISSMEQGPMVPRLCFGKQTRATERDCSGSIK
jgi:hypothetical protein